jgi:hypothetical protein
LSDDRINVVAIVRDTVTSLFKRTAASSNHKIETIEDSASDASLAQYYTASVFSATSEGDSSAASMIVEKLATIRDRINRCASRQISADFQCLKSLMREVGELQSNGDISALHGCIEKICDELNRIESRTN